MRCWQVKIFARLIIVFLLNTANVFAFENINWIKNYEHGITLAAERQQPAFIYFHAPWCSWCYVYERDTLADEQIIKAIQQYYVPILVNYDARPDLVKKYSGFGLPFTVIVSHRGERLLRLPGVLTPQDMLRTLQRAINIQAVSVFSTTENLHQVSTLDTIAYKKFLAHWLEHLESLYQPTTGTFSGILDSGATLKRPAALAWIFMLENGLWPARTKRAAQVTLANLYDKKNGGFFYFRNPHREDKYLETAKLLDANGWLIYWFSQAGKYQSNTALLTAANHSSNYLLQVLWDNKNGGFFQAQVSDAEYYKSADFSRLKYPPSIDKIKRTDTNAQAVIALLKIARLTNKPAKIKAADNTLHYLMAQHLQNNRLYHAYDNNVHGQGLGHAYNLGEDIFWLLAAIQETRYIDKIFVSKQQSQQIYKLAKQWLSTAQSCKTDCQLPNKVLGIIAWVAVNSDNVLVNRQTANWALQQIRIEVDTRPDELVYALKAWQAYLNLLK